MQQFILKEKKRSLNWQYSRRFYKFLYFKYVLGKFRNIWDK